MKHRFVLTSLLLIRYLLSSIIFHVILAQALTVGGIKELADVKKGRCDYHVCMGP